MKRAFKVKQKTCFLVSEVLSFKHKKQTSKNVADKTFKVKHSPLFVFKKFLFKVKASELQHSLNIF